MATTFIYTSDLEAEEEIELIRRSSPPTAAATDLTLFVDLDRWFRDGAGTLVDPATAATPAARTRAVVENNIKAPCTPSRTRTRMAATITAATTAALPRSGIDG